MFQCTTPNICTSCLDYAAQCQQGAVQHETSGIFKIGVSFKIVHLVFQFASLGKQADAALEEFKNDVKNKSFPSDEYSPYVIPEDELEQFKKMMDEEG